MHPTTEILEPITTAPTDQAPTTPEHLRFEMTLTPDEYAALEFMVRGRSRSDPRSLLGVACRKVLTMAAEQRAAAIAFLNPSMEQLLIETASDGTDGFSGPWREQAIAELCERYGPGGLGELSRSQSDARST